MGNLLCQWFGLHDFLDMQHTPSPFHPHGKLVDVSFGARPACWLNLRYPAEGIGVFIVNCTQCHRGVVLTTRGARDDPRRLIVSCNYERPA